MKSGIVVSFSLFYYGKTEDSQGTTRAELAAAYDQLTWQVCGRERERKDLTSLAPRGWPHLTYLSEEDHK